MGDSILGNLENFESVWPRVTGSRSEAAAQRRAEADDAAVLRRFMDGEASDAAYYTGLAQRCPDSSRQILISIAADEKEHLRRLQLEYFLMTGDTYVPSLSCPMTGGLLALLRKAYVHELEGAASYLSAAGDTDKSRLMLLYPKLAKDESRHAEAVVGLIEKAMT